jgi:putative FmdB family regulatory protein
MQVRTLDWIFINNYGEFFVAGTCGIFFNVCMPFYEFTCQDCKKDSEILVRSMQWSGTSCPHCHSIKLEKKLSVFAAVGSQYATAADLPPCSGVPTSCGRCTVD